MPPEAEEAANAKLKMPSSQIRSLRVSSNALVRQGAIHKIRKDVSRHSSRDINTYVAGARTRASAGANLQLQYRFWPDTHRPGSPRFTSAIAQDGGQSGPSQWACRRRERRSHRLHC